MAAFDADRDKSSQGPSIEALATCLMVVSNRSRIDFAPAERVRFAGVRSRSLVGGTGAGAVHQWL